MGAHHVIDHRQPPATQVKAIIPGGVNYVLALTTLTRSSPRWRRKAHWH
jgi:hypothetical protein